MATSPDPTRGSSVYWCPRCGAPYLRPGLCEGSPDPTTLTWTTHPPIARTVRPGYEALA